MSETLHETRSRLPSRRARAVVALAAFTAFGIAGCTSASENSSAPATADITAEAPQSPSCVVEAHATAGNSVSISLNTQNTDERGFYDVGKTEYDFGDGLHDNNGSQVAESHRYPRPGKYIVSAELILDSSGAAGDPIRNGAVVGCTPATVIVEG